MSSLDTEPQRRTLDDASAEVVSAGEVEFDVETDVLIAGAGGCGLTATLAACENEDLTVTLLEKSGEVGGNAALSTGMIPPRPARASSAKWGSRRDPRTWHGTSWRRTATRPTRNWSGTSVRTASI